MGGVYAVLIDAHCHIDRFPNPTSLAADCERERITTVAVTNLPSHYKMGVQHLIGFKYVKLALGFHPLVIGQHGCELEEFLRFLPDVAFVGEIGLDFSREGIETKAQQLKVFRLIAEAVSGSSKFITLHSRGAANDVLDVLEECGVRNAVFHWYSGTLSVLDRAIEKGFYFSVNPSMVDSKKGQGIIARIPRERTLTETDGPYVKVGGRPAEPRDVRGVVNSLASEWEVSVDEAAKQVFDNFRRIMREVE